MPYTKIIECGDSIEFYEYEKTPVYVAPYREKNKKRDRVRDVAATYARRANNVLQLKKRFIRLVRANTTGNDNPALFTLTMLEVLPIEDAYAAFTLFIKRLRTCTPKNVRYVAVPEFQKRGAVHFHALIWGLHPLTLFPSSQKKIGGTPQFPVFYEKQTRSYQNLWQLGYLDCSPTNNSPALAFYLAKYMSKAMLDPRLGFKKAYVASRNALRPLQRSHQEDFDSVRDFYLAQGYELSPRQVKEFDTYWLGRGRYQLYLKTAK